MTSFRRIKLINRWFAVYKGRQTLKYKCDKKGRRILLYLISRIVKNIIFIKSSYISVIGLNINRKYNVIKNTLSPYNTLIIRVK